MIAKLSLAAGAAVLALSSLQPALACHRFHTWNYPWPQRCDDKGLARPLLPPARPVIELASDPLPLMPMVDVFDQRTSQEIEDQEEHDQAVADHKDELNWLLARVHSK